MAEGHFIRLSLCEKVSLLASVSWPQCTHCQRGPKAEKQPIDMELPICGSNT